MRDIAGELSILEHLPSHPQLLVSTLGVDVVE